MRHVLAGLTLLGLVVPAASFAQIHNAARPTSNSQVKTGHGIGIIQALDLKAGNVTIKHGPIPAVGWPAMTMTFAAPLALLKQLHVGQKIAFTTRIRKMDAQLTQVLPQ